MDSRRGVVTFLFTDLVDSTRILASLGEDAAERLRQDYFGLQRKAVSDAGGEEVKNLGDGLMVAFTSPVDALRCAVAIQRAVDHHNATGPRNPLGVRVGVHAGQPMPEGDDYFGTPVVVAKRLCDRARGGQILASALVAGLVGNRDGIRVSDMGALPLKGLPDPVPSVAVEWQESSRTPPTAPAGRPTLPPVRRPAAARPRGGARTVASLAGRTRELHVMERQLERASAGELRVLLVGGDPGVGKTRLAGELLERDPAGIIRVDARGYPLGATVAYGLWIEALESLLDAMLPEEVAEVCGDYLDDLATVLRRAAVVRGPAPAGGPPPRLADGIARVLGNLSQRATVVAVLDDLHLADPSSWEALRRLARQRSRCPILVIGTVRPAELAQNQIAAHVQFELEQDGILEHLHLAPLAVDDIRELVAGVLEERPPAALVQWLADRSEGNPLFALGLLRALLDEGADLSAPALRRLPVGLADRVRTRLARHDEAVQRILECVAVVGRPVTMGEIQALTDRDPLDLAGQLAELVLARALVEDERGRELSYAFSHSLIRDAVYQDIGGARRRVLHRQAGQSLARSGRVAEAARHLARGAELGDTEAIDMLLVAVREAEGREAYREALELIGELVELLPEGDPRWRDVFDAVAWDAEWVVDHRADSRADVAVVAMRAIDALFDASGEEPIRRARVKRRLGTFLAWGGGNLEQAAAVCAQATALFTAAGDTTAALLARHEEAFIAGLRGDLAGMEAREREIVAAAETSGERSAALRAHHGLAYSLAFQGRGEAEAWCSRAIEIATADDNAYRLTTALGLLGWLQSTQGRIDEAQATLRRARELNPGYRDTILVEQKVVLDWVAGDVRAAVAGARESVAWDPSGPSLRREVGMAAGCIAAIEADDPAEAAQFLARAERAMAGLEWSVMSPLTRVARGMCEWHAGRGEFGLGQVRQGAARLMDVNACAWAWPALVEVVDLAAVVGDLDAAGEAIDQLATVAAVMELPGHHGLVAWARGRVAQAGGQAPSARAAAREAVELVGTTGWSGYLARALSLLGRTTDDRAEAVAALERSAALYDRGGAAWRRAGVLGDLSRLGSAGRRAAAAASGPSSLSPRERDVAALAAAGLSAREIAERLFVGERTVETHLSRIYPKLGVDSKLELVRRAAEFGL